MENNKQYWRENIRLISCLLLIWAMVSFGGGIIFVDALSEFTFIGYPLGFWIATQGAIYTFIALIAYYVYAMNKLDKKYGVDE